MIMKEWLHSGLRWCLIVFRRVSMGGWFLKCCFGVVLWWCLVAFGWDSMCGFTALKLVHSGLMVVLSGVEMGSYVFF